MICKNPCILLRVSTIAVCKHKHYSATCKFRCGQWGLKIALEWQIRIGSSVNTEPVCFSDWVTWPKTDRQTDRQTRQADAREDEGDRHVVPEWLIRSVVFQPTAAHWRTLSPWRVQTHKQIEMSPTPTLSTHAMSSSVSFGFSPRLSVCLSLFTSSCLSVDLTPISLSPPTLSSFSWWFIRLYSTCCYVWQNGDGRLLGAVTWIHSHIRYPPD